ncbi:putative ribonuclease H-like domain-containing protein [Tanacetum coccineum]
MVPRAVLMKTGLRSLNTARPVNTAHPKTIVYSARPMSHFSKSAQSTVKMPLVNAVKEKLEIMLLGRVILKEDQGYVDSGCSRHMTGNMSYLSDFKEFDGGYVTFGGGAKQSENYWIKELLNGFLLKDLKENCTVSDMKNIIHKMEFKTFLLQGHNLMNPLIDIGASAEAVNIACYMQNRVLVVKPHNKTPYELFRGRTPALSFIRPFGCHVTFLIHLDYLDKFDGQSDEGFFGVITHDIGWTNVVFDIDVLTNINNHKDHSLDHVIRDVQSGVQTRRMTKTSNEQEFISVVYKGKTHEDLHICLFACFLSQVEPKKVIQALTDPSWIEAMQDELLQFKLQKVWTLVDLLYGKRAIRTKWVYRNKKDERGIVIRNKARLVAQGYTQEEGIDYDEVFALVARIEAIRLFLAYVSFKDFIVYQIDVKSAFLYGKIEEEVYVCQPPVFEDLEFPNRVYKIEKALYGLNQAPRAWYETLSTYLLDNGFRRGIIDKTLFIKKVKGDIILVQVYVDDIIFRSIKKNLCTEFEKLMHKKFQMSSMGELTFFLGLQVT